MVVVVGERPDLDAGVGQGLGGPSFRRNSSGRFYPSPASECEAMLKDLIMLRKSLFALALAAAAASPARSNNSC